MTRNLGGPREGNCRARSWRTTSDFEPLTDELLDEQDHGLMPWAEFITQMEAAGATRPTYDWFDVTEADGTHRRYRVVSEGFVP